MDRALIIRAGGIYVPIAAAIALTLWRHPKRSMGAGILLACVWNAESVLALNILAVRAG